ncbi:MAG: hypothetical protein JOZ31_00045 [Verrucomicrobia bacterium]|nr:hypothetical protein [Verrucomicrobiota bacterium]
MRLASLSDAFSPQLDGIGDYLCWLCAKEFQDMHLAKPVIAEQMAMGLLTTQTATP